jgi:catechol-2,3-dioxygenase
VSRPLHHVALGAHDVEGVAGFYRDVLDLELIARHAATDGSLRSVWLRTGAVVLMVERTEAELRRVEGVGAGPFLLAFVVSREERAEVEARVERAGERVEARTEHSSYFRDPEGNRVAVSHYPLPDEAS